MKQLRQSKFKKGTTEYENIASPNGEVKAFRVNSVSGNLEYTTDYSNFSEVGGGQEVLTGASDPTTATVGEVGQFYLNTTTKALFQCQSAGGGSYTWGIPSNLTFKKIAVPSSTTLTDDEIANIILGCQIDGNFLNLVRPTLFPAREIAGSVYRGVMIGYLTSGNAYIGMYEINKGTKVISQLAQTNNLVDLRSIANLYVGNYTINIDQFGQLQIGNANATSMQFDGSTIRAQNIVPTANNQKDLGSSAMKWKDLYLSGNLTDGTNSVSVEQLLSGFKALTLTSTTLTADQVTTIQNYNVVLQSDITLGSGTTLHAQTILTRPFSYSNTLRGLYIDNSKIGTYLINTNTNTLGQGAQDIIINGIAQLNGKAIPNYPADNTKTYNLQQVNGTLAWIENNIPTLLTFTNTSVSQADWVADSTYTDYGYKATITLSGITADMIPQVIFGATEAVSGNYLPIAESFAGGIYIYSKVNDAITIPTIIVQKAV